jgi:DNA helicase HerA-like ATPase
VDDLNLVFGKNKNTEAKIIGKFANRHGVITGATGTGKTVTLQALAERFSGMGVPVIAADIKGDLSGILRAGNLSPKIAEILKTREIEAPASHPNPVEFWDVFGETGNPLRSTISEMGPLLLSQLLNLNEVQEGVLNVAFKVADDQQLLLIDLADLRALLAYIAENAGEFNAKYGAVSATSVGAIQRSLLVLENQGGAKFFGQPEVQLADLIRTDASGNGVINLLDATKLMGSPKVYATFLLWVMSELFEQLPEVGDMDKPKLVFFFDEAHLLFEGAPKTLTDKVEQVVKLIRSKGVGIYFVTQNPLDIPESVLAQLGNRIQHALRAYTPMEQKAVKAAASAFRTNPKLNTEEVITQLEVGEALVSCLDGKGAPSVVERVYILPPASQIGPLDAPERQAVLTASPLNLKYKDVVNQLSAEEKLASIKSEQDILKQQAEEAKQAEKQMKEAQKAEPAARKSTRKSPTERMVGNILGSIGTRIGSEIARGILGGIKKL